MAEILFTDSRNVGLSFCWTAYIEHVASANTVTLQQFPF